MKRDFLSLVEQLDEDNYNAILDAIYYLSKNTRKLLSSRVISKTVSEAGICDTPRFKQEVSDEHGEEAAKVTPGDAVQEDVSITKSVRSENEGKPEYTVHLHRKGLEGRCPGHEPIFISEYLARMKGIMPGDKVWIEKKGLDEKTNKYRYFVTIASSGHDSPESIYTTFEMGLVEQLEEKQVVKTNVNGLELPFTFEIPHCVVEKYRIEEGDLVDIRYQRNDTEGTTANIIWKHSVVAKREATVSNKVLEHRPSADELEEDETTAAVDLIESREIPEKFKNKQVLLVGMAMKTEEFRKQLETYDSTLDVYGSNKTSKRLRQKIQKADVVLIAKSHNSHSNGDDAKKYAKKYRKNYDLFNGFSPNQFLNSYLKALSS